MKVKLLKKIRKRYDYGYGPNSDMWWFKDKSSTILPAHYPFSWDIIFFMAVRTVGEDEMLKWRDKKIHRDIL